MADRDEEMGKILRNMHSLELRLSRLESALNITYIESVSTPEEQLEASAILINENETIPEERGIESQIGRFGLAWLGNIVLLFGITFLSQYIMILGHRFFSALFGFLATGALFFLADYIKKSNEHLSSVLKMNSLVLLFYTTLRLHFFTLSPLIPHKTIAVVLLLLLVGIQIYLSVRYQSQAYGALAVFFSLTTAIMGDSTNLTLTIVVFTSVATVYSFKRYNWEALLIVTVFLVYITFFLWLFGNPLAGHPMQMITEHQYGVIYLMLLGAAFSIISYFRKSDSVSDDFQVSVIFINGILFTLILLLIVLRYFSTGYVTLFTIVTVFSLMYSILLHSKSDWHFASAFYALYGFMAMSISLYGVVGLPKVYLLLSLQSLIVVSMALWFRNRLIIVVNSLLFMTIMVVYLVTSKNDNGVNFCLALTALVSARIINWKRSRLQIKTDLIRNFYMIEGFLMMLLALYHAVPKQFVTFSWTMAALLYFVISLLLKNIKYRYMALGTMICSAFYLFIVDLARIELIYRVLALLFLAAISIGISIYYTNRVKKQGT
jgi:hypothetical protein